MLKVISFFVAFTIIVIACTNKGLYKNDGVYEGHSQSKYKEEPYMGFTKVFIKNGEIDKIEFKIVDTSKNELFDSLYYKHYLDNPEYMEQCHKDWKGVLDYPEKLLKVQDINRVDAVTGATWSYNLFKSSVNIALKKAN